MLSRARKWLAQPVTLPAGCWLALLLGAVVGTFGWLR